MVTFVGIHFKEGKTALDSSTLSGRKIDAVIEKLNCITYKYNLFPYYEIPKNKWMRKNAIDCFRWIVRDKGIIVLLGNNVQKYFPYEKYPNSTIIKFRHPSFSKKTFSNDLLQVIEKSLTSSSVKF